MSGPERNVSWDRDGPPGKTRATHKTRERTGKWPRRFEWLLMRPVYSAGEINRSMQCYRFRVPRCNGRRQGCALRSSRKGRPESAAAPARPLAMPPNCRRLENVPHVSSAISGNGASPGPLRRTARTRPRHVGLRGGIGPSTGSCLGAKPRITACFPRRGLEHGVHSCGRRYPLGRMLAAHATSPQADIRVLKGTAAWKKFGWQRVGNHCFRSAEMRGAASERRAGSVTVWGDPAKKLGLARDRDVSRARKRPGPHLRNRWAWAA